MTETKRYSFNWERGHSNFWDNHCDLADCYLTCEDVVDRLNELNDENQELKTENKELKRKGLDMEMDRDYYHTKSASLEEGYLQLQRENDRLLKENEQLKQQKGVWKQSCCSNSNFNSILLHELDIAQEQGYEVSNPFKQFLENREDVE